MRISTPLIVTLPDFTSQSRASKFAMVDLPPVSYTHLDVYKRQQLYYRLLKYRYFEAGNTNEDVMLMLDDMPSTTYYRNRKKAIRLYATMLWAFTRPKKIQNKMEEINWKKSGSKVAVN